jgi:glycosyltransferase involved in cell wall biosynthesis
MKNQRERKILFLATVDVTIYAFLIPHMKLLKDIGYEVEVAASNVGFTERIEREGFKVYNLLFSRNPLNISNLKASVRLYRIMKENKYIMLHTHTPVASFLGRIVAKIAGVPHIVYTAHGFHFHEYGNKIRNFIYYRLEKVAGRFTDVLITTNKDDYKIAKEKNIVPNGKVVYIKGVGVDLERFNPQGLNRIANINLSKDFKTNNDFLIIVIAELIKRKNIIDILKAAKIVAIHDRAFKLLIVGDGPLKVELMQFAKSEKSINERTLFLVRRSDIPELLSISNLFVMTSYHEGLPRAMMEAMAMEKPIVAYDIRGVRDLVEDGLNGFLVPFGDVNALAEKVLYLMEHPEVARAMGKKGRERVEKEFNLNVILPQMEKLYRDILETEEK